MLDRDSILQADDLAREEVDVPEWGGRVYVRVMTGAERDSYEQACLEATKDGRADVEGLRVRLLLMTLSDDKGSTLFTAQDADVLAGKSAAAIDRCFQVALRLNGLTEEAGKDAAGNSNGDRSGDSGSS